MGAVILRAETDLAESSTRIKRLARLLQIPASQEQPNRMLRITIVESSAKAVTLRVEGRIAGPWVDELRTTCNVHAEPGPVQLSLELGDVSFADAAGVEFLKELRDQGVRFSHPSPFLKELFNNDFSPDGR